VVFWAAGCFARAAGGRPTVPRRRHQQVRRAKRMGNHGPLAIGCTPPQLRTTGRLRSGSGGLRLRSIGTPAQAGALSRDPLLVADERGA